MRTGMDPCLLLRQVLPKVIDPMAVYCWSTFYDAGPSLNEYCIDVSCFLCSYECTF